MVRNTDYKLGDIFGTLGGTPDFGLEADYINPVKRSLDVKRGVKGRRGGGIKVQLA